MGAVALGGHSSAPAAVDPHHHPLDLARVERVDDVRARAHQHLICSQLHGHQVDDRLELLLVAQVAHDRADQTRVGLGSR